MAKVLACLGEWQVNVGENSPEELQLEHREVRSDSGRQVPSLEEHLVAWEQTKVEELY